MRLLLPLLSIACADADGPLGEVRIEGASPAFEAELRQELRAFELAVGAGRIHLRFVRVVDEVHGDEDVAGGYRNHRILLAAGAPASVLRHELCHAVHDADGLLDRPDPLWDEVAAGLFLYDEYARAALRDHYRTARRQRHEAMASFCGLGPAALDALTDPCPGEPPRAAEVADWLLRRVYRDHEDPGPLERPAAVTMDGWAEPVSSVRPGAGGDTVVVDVLGETTEWRLADGAWVGEGGEPGASIDQVEPLWSGSYALSSAGAVDGRQAQRSWMPLYHLGAAEERLFARTAPDDDGCPGGCWRRVDEACAGPSREWMFTIGADVWRAWSDGAMVRWDPIAEAE